jgi:hypothetical protein
LTDFVAASVETATKRAGHVVEVVGEDVVVGGVPG